MKCLQLRGEGPFKSSSPVKEYFSTSRETFGGHPTTEKKERKIFMASAQHDTKFRPSCIRKF